MYNRNFQLYEKELNRMMNNFQFQLVVYDESEQFREYTDELFDYPYEARKQIMGKQQLNLR